MASSQPLFTLFTLRRMAAVVALIAVFAVALGADTPAFLRGEDSQGPIAYSTEFQFVRLKYTAENDGFGRGDRWLTDWPEAEQHLMDGIRRLTRIDNAPESRLMGIMDEKLFDYPWLYAVEVGGWILSEEEAARLREYLLRGGFLMVDDFHGTYEWEVFAASMQRVFPDRPIIDIPRSDSIFHTVYDLNDPVQIPGIGPVMRGMTYEKGGVTPHWRGIYDDSGRLMVVINFNMDLGDAWEHADVPEYAVLYTARAYQHAIDYVVYAMTH